MVHFGEFLNIWSLRSNSVTRQVSFNWTKIGGKCQNSNATFWVFFKQFGCAGKLCYWKFLPFSSMLEVPLMQSSWKKFWSFYTCGKATNAAVVGPTSPNSLLSMRRSAAALLLYLSLSFSSFSFLHGHGHGQVLGFLSLVLLLRSDLRCFAVVLLTRRAPRLLQENLGWDWPSMTTTT